LKVWQIRARSLARRLGLIRVIHRVRALRPQDYEERVRKALRDAIRTGDVVWDIGANVGFYTEQFCTWVGEQGRVVAFEPFPGSCEQLRERLPNCAWLRVENMALSDVDGTAMLASGENSTTNHLVTEADAVGDSAGLVEVTVRMGDTYAKQGGRMPNVIKLDVEGFEQEVLAGLGQTLRSAELRALLVEVHFAKLEARGQTDAPVAIEKLLRGSGFRVEWVDASHLFATR
jgi:FkbM family methyltransferase